MEHILTTERLVLRPIEDKDEDDIIRGASDFAVAKWLSMVPHPYIGADGQWFIDHVKASPHGYWAITRAGQFLGVISIKPDLGYWLAPAHWGQGVMSEAASAVVAAYFENPAAGPLMSGYFIENARSAAVLCKLGFANKGPIEEEYSKSLGRKNLHRKVALTPEQWHFLNPVEIKTERLRIRPNEAHHMTAIHAIAAQQKVAQNLGSFPHPLDVAFIEERVERGRWRGSWNGWFHIADPAGAVLGMIGFYSPTQGQEDDIGIGYAIDPKAWGQGIMSEALRAFCDFIFERYRAGKIQASCFDDNPASQRVLEKAGFEPFEKDMEKSAARSEKSPITRYRLIPNGGASDGTGH